MLKDPHRASVVEFQYFNGRSVAIIIVNLRWIVCRYMSSTESDRLSRNKISSGAKFSARPVKILAHDLNPKATQAPAPWIHPAAPTSASSALTPYYPCRRPTHASAPADARLHLVAPADARPAASSTQPRPAPLWLRPARRPGCRPFACVHRLHPVAPADARWLHLARCPDRRSFGFIQHAAPIRQIHPARIYFTKCHRPIDRGVPGDMPPNLIPQNLIPICPVSQLLWTSAWVLYSCLCTWSGCGLWFTI